MNSEAIRRRIIDSAVAGFASANPREANDGLFTTAHYAVAVKNEFRTEGPPLDGGICRQHLTAMDDVEQVGPCLWRKVGTLAAAANLVARAWSVADRASRDVGR